jgi:hypothetical protein
VGAHFLKTLRVAKENENHIELQWGQLEPTPELNPPLFVLKTKQDSSIYLLWSFACTETVIDLIAAELPHKGQLGDGQCERISRSISWKYAHIGIRK